jgi:hypothetical protein
MTSIVGLAVRQVLTPDNSTDATPSASAKPQCGGGGLSAYDPFNMGLHIGALFVILATSTFGRGPFVLDEMLTCDFRCLLSSHVKADSRLENPEVTIHDCQILRKRCHPCDSLHSCTLLIKRQADI